MGMTGCLHMQRGISEALLLRTFLITLRYMKMTF